MSGQQWTATGDMVGQSGKKRDEKPELGIEVE